MNYAAYSTDQLRADTADALNRLRRLRRAMGICGTSQQRAREERITAELTALRAEMAKRGDLRNAVPQRYGWKYADTAI